MDIEHKVRWNAAPKGLQAYAEALCVRSFGNNPFSPITESSFPGGAEKLAEFKAHCIRAIVEAITSQGRFSEGRGVQSPYTVLHVVAHV